MKNKKIILFVIIIAVIILLPIISFFVFKKSKTESAKTVSDQSELSKIAQKEEKSLVYNDTAGFKFNYPQSVTVKDTSNNDPNAYSLLELSSAKNEGKMLIKIVDSSLNSVDQWLKSKEASGAGVSREIMISQMPGKQIQFENSSKLISLAISDGIMYDFESPLDNTGFWNKTHNQIISSFSQNGATGQAVVNNEGGTDTDGEAVSEDEEVIE